MLKQHWKKFILRFLVKRYNVILSPHFNNMLSETLEAYKSFNLNYSLKVEQKITTAIYILEFFLYSFSSFHVFPLSDDFRKIIILERFLIIYKISKNNVYLLYFLDGRRNINSSDLFKN